MPARTVFLIGFMATGKSTVGRRLAERLGRPFVDLDELVQAEAGCSVREIFAGEGEAGFRARERAALEQVLGAEPSVVATGGGTPCVADSLALMQQRGVVVALTAPLDEVTRRVVDPLTRPLLAGPPERVRALYDSRAAIYRQAACAVATEGRAVQDVVVAAAAGVAAAEALPDELAADPVVVGLGGRSYPVVTAAAGLDRLGALARGRFGERTAMIGLVTDDQVGPLYAERAEASLAAAGFAVRRVVVPAGEASKQLPLVERVAEELVAGGLDRGSAIVALGGGVVGDLAGFVAASLLRGLPWGQVATTTIAMVDSAIGGKTGVNLAAGKNLLGAFWQPAFVLSDPALLATLPARERRAAAGELIKYGLLDGEELMASLEGALPAHCAGDPAGPDLAVLLRRCARYKAWVVARDEHERTGDRARLNLGHTLGHAIEAAAGYGRVLHGEAVALGLVAACRVSARLGLCEPALEARVAALVAACGLEADLAPWLGDEVLARVAADKKRAADRIRFVALRGPGAVETVELGLAELPGFLRP